MNDHELSVRQPQAGDIVGSTLQIAALGTAFEASWEWKLTTATETLATGYFQGGGSVGLMASFVFEAKVENVTYVGPATFEFNGDTGNENPETTKVPVVVVAGATGYVPYRVQEGDTLTKIASSNPWSSTVTTVKSIVAANNLSNPDYIEVGQLLRLPV